MRAGQPAEEVENEAETSNRDRSVVSAGVAQSGGGGRSGRSGRRRPGCRRASRSCGISPTSRAATSGTGWTCICPRRPRAGCRWSSGFTAGRGGPAAKKGCPALPLAAKGYAVASINYRLSQHALFPAQIEDCKAAIRWLRANADEVPPRPGAHRRVGRLGRRPPGRPAGHHRRREGLRRHGRQPRPVQPRAVRRRLVRPHGPDDDGRQARQA